jgi:phage shock protein A
MALLERVSTLLRANLNDLLDKAEDPEKLSKQILLDMENQLLQVKTQVAVAIADQHRMQKQQREHAESQATWRRKAEIAVSKSEDDMARGALERALTHQRLSEGFAQQCTDQTADVETLRAAYSKLQHKLDETKARVELLLAQHRKNRAVEKAHPEKALATSSENAARLARLGSAVAAGEANAAANRAMRAIAGSDTLEERFQTMEQQDEIEALLLELKSNQPRLHG